MTIDEALAMFALQLEADGRSVHTRKNYERHIGLLARAMPGVEVGEITHVDLARFLVSQTVTHAANGAPKKATTVNAIRSSLRTWFGWLHAAGIIPSNPARLIRRAYCASAPARSLSEEEQRRLLDTLARAQGWQAERDHLLVHLLLASGVRLTTALALDCADVDVERGELRLRRAKGDRDQRALLGDGIRAHLLSYLPVGYCGPVFRSRQGRRLSARQCQRRFADWVRLAGIDGRASPHGLRHALAMRLYTRTRDVLLVKEALGHRSIVSTMSYVRPTDSALRQAFSV